MKKAWLYKISPCMIAAVASLVFIIDSLAGMTRSGGWSFIGVIVFFPAMIAVIIIDLVIKTFVKDTGTLWLIELLIVLLGILLLVGWAKGGIL